MIHIRAIAEDFAGRGAAESAKALDRGGQVSLAYDAAPPVAQKRFDALAAEATGWASVAAQALLGDGSNHPPRAAAAHLADEIARAQREMERLLGLA